MARSRAGVPVKNRSARFTPIPPALLETLVALVPAGLRGALRTADRAPDGPGLPPAPMPVVAPPAATNDNPLRAVHEAVERDLRASGHLR